MKQTIIMMLAAVMAFTASAVAAPVESIAVTADQKPKKKAKTELKEVTFHVHLHCNNCVKKVNENIAFEKGVKGLDVSLENQTVVVKYDPSKTSVETLKKAIESLGYETHPADAHE